MYELHAACKAGNIRLIEKLIKDGHDIKQTDSHGKPPMYYAIYYDQFAAALYLLEHEAKQIKDPHESNVALASQLTVTAQLFLYYRKTENAIKSYKKAIETFDLLEDMTDNQVRLFIDSLQKYMQLMPNLSNLEAIELTRSIITIHLTIRDKNEIDHLVYIFNWHNLAETWRASNDFKQATLAYLKSIEGFSQIKKNTRDLIEKSVTTFTGLSDCYQKGSLENKFYLFAAACLTTESNAHEKIEDMFLTVIHKSNNPSLRTSAITLIDMLSNLYQSDVLNNKDLRKYLEDETNQLLLKRFRQSLESNGNKKNDYTSLNSLFHPTKDTMDDNLPPLTLERTHAWTLQS